MEHHWTEEVFKKARLGDEESVLKVNKMCEYLTGKFYYRYFNNENLRRAYPIEDALQDVKAHIFHYSLQIYDNSKLKRKKENPNNISFFYYGAIQRLGVEKQKLMTNKRKVFLNNDSVDRTIKHDKSETQMGELITQNGLYGSEEVEVEKDIEVMDSINTYRKVIHISNSTRMAVRKVKVFNLMVQGYKSSEIAKVLGYLTREGIEGLKVKIRKDIAAFHKLTEEQKIEFLEIPYFAPENEELIKAAIESVKNKLQDRTYKTYLKITECSCQAMLLHEIADITGKKASGISKMQKEILETTARYKKIKKTGDSYNAKRIYEIAT
ncbi:hypothetical protein ABEX78_32185 [Priestia megaterium]